MSNRGIGDNSAPFGQELRADLEAMLNEESDRLFIYAQWHIGDYIIGTQGMSLEHEGAYQRFLMRLYARGKPLPDDDGIMASIMSLSTRVWRRIRETLVNLGKIIVKAGCLTNARFERERIKRSEQLKKRSQAAHTRWAMDRENNTEKERDAARVSLKFAPSLPETSPKLPENVPEKHNKINGVWDKSAYANLEPITKDTTTLSARELFALVDRMQEAAAPALASPGKYLRLDFTDFIERWLRADCDFEKDILPGIRKAAAPKQPGEITTWQFFEKPILEMRDRRLIPAPEPIPRTAQQPHWRDLERDKSLKHVSGMAEAKRRIAEQKR